MQHTFPFTSVCTWARARCGGLGVTSYVFLSNPGELFILKCGVWHPASFELRELTDDESSLTSRPIADRRLRSAPPQRSMPSADESGLFAKVNKKGVLVIQIQYFHLSYQLWKNNNKNPLQLTEMMMMMNFPLSATVIKVIAMKMMAVKLIFSHGLSRGANGRTVLDPQDLGSQKPRRRQRPTPRGGRRLAEGGGCSAAWADGVRSGIV